MINNKNYRFCIFKYVLFFHRNCIGQNFAMNEMRACIAVVLRNFLLTVDERKPVAIVPELILRAKDGLWLHAKPISA